MNEELKHCGGCEDINSSRYTGKHVDRTYEHQPKRKRAFITGITGQDGSYLAELLLSKGYEVHGLVRRASTFGGLQRIDHIHDEKRLFLHYGDMTDPFSLLWALKKSNPDEVYNLAAQSHVQVSWETPWYTAQTTGIGLLNLLESIRVLGISPRVYQASTSELFRGNPESAPQNENTVKDPVSPYGSAKLYAFQIAKNYREAHGMFICNGILFNHESPRRGDNFVTKKIVDAAKRGDEVHLGNLDAKRDWGYAPEYMEAAWKMLQHRTPEDFVIATGYTNTVKEFVEWISEISGKNMKVVIDEKYVRPAEVDVLQGDASKASHELDWTPTVTGKEVARKMYDSTK